jgi:UDP-N-acetylmuramoyl-tripeptide--D-alanyl-D-alanine ligase
VKSLLFSEIQEQIGGHILHGEGNPAIHNVMTRSKKEIEDHTLVFHLSRDLIRGRYWRDHRSVVIITDEPEQCSDLGEGILLVEVKHVEEAYWKFVDYYRGLFQIPVIGVTGTCGKTTAKEMMKQILRQDRKVRSTWMSMNSKSENLRYLLGIDDETEIAVFEMPVVYPGYLRNTCRYFQPQIRILLNIGIHHMADCDTPEDYMRAKAEIVEGLDPVHGTLILNADDDNIRRAVNVEGLQRVIYFGKSEGCDFRAAQIQYADKGMSFNLLYQGKSYEAFVPGYGEYNVYDALASLAAVMVAGMDLETAIQRLAGIRQVEEHMEFKTGAGGCTVIDDTWNSSSLSTAMGIQVLKDVSAGKKAIAVLGYIPQLDEGFYADIEYAKLGVLANASGVDLLIIAGHEANEIGSGALSAGMDAAKVHFCDSGTDIYAIIEPHLDENAVVLLEITHRVMRESSYRAMKRKLIPESEK